MKELAGGFYRFFPRSYCLFMLTIMYANIPPAARSTDFRQKAKSTFKLPKRVDGQAGAENQKAAEHFRGLVKTN
jgi:hypothetical protein